MNHLGPNNETSSYLWIYCKKLLKIFHNEKSQ